MKDFFAFDNMKRLLILWVKAFGIAVAFEIIVKIGIPAFIIVLIVSLIWLYKK